MYCIVLVTSNQMLHKFVICGIIVEKVVLPQNKCYRYKGNDVKHCPSIVKKSNYLLSNATEKGKKR